MFKLNSTPFAVPRRRHAHSRPRCRQRVGCTVGTDHHGSQQIAVRETATSTSQIDNAPVDRPPATRSHSPERRPRNGTEQGS